ncbi:lariat debranching enzyme [Balamuthia mandrillaris]
MEAPTTAKASPMGEGSTASNAPKTGLKVAVVGCTHGELDTIFERIAGIEQARGIKVELVLCCGDFEACRNEYDLSCLSGPSKYHYFKDFYKYYNGEAVAPIPIIFVGGNHEACNHLLELYYGGWAAPNIYFLGYSGVVNFGDLRIGGFSGIFKHYDFEKGHYEVPPYRDEGSKRSAFHVRNYELQKLRLLRQPLDIIMSHDWPDGMTVHGDEEKLLRDKPFFAQEIKQGQLGCRHYTQLMHMLKPTWWLSGHMHSYFEAQVPHNLDGSVEGGASFTRFLALDKPLPKRHFLHVIDFPDKTGGSKELSYDLEWLAILRTMHPYFSFSATPFALPKIKQLLPNLEKELVATKKIMEEKGSYKIPTNFEMTVEPHRSVKAATTQAAAIHSVPQNTFHRFCKCWVCPTFGKPINRTTTAARQQEDRLTEEEDEGVAGVEVAEEVETNGGVVEEVTDRITRKADDTQRTSGKHPLVACFG